MLLRLFAIIRQRPFVWAGALFALWWACCIGFFLRDRFGVPPLDRSRTVMASGQNLTLLIRTTPSGAALVETRRIGPVAPWKNGIVYWDAPQQCFFCVLPGQPARSVVPRPALEYPPIALRATEDAVYAPFDRVSLADGTRPPAQSTGGSYRPVSYTVTRSDNRVWFAPMGREDDIKMWFPSGKTHVIPNANLDAYSMYDWDVKREAVVWLETDALCYESPTRSWRTARRAFTDYHAVGINEATGDVWVLVSDSSEKNESGMWVISAKGRERGWRWRGEVTQAEALHRFVELTPEQEKLFRNLAH